MPILEGIFGMEGAKRMAARLVADSSVHALLLYGAPGGSQALLADFLTRAWLCSAPSGEGACGQCQACLAFGRGNNPDCQFVRPHGPGQMITVDTITKSKKPTDVPTVPVRDFVRIQPLMSRHKVIVFVDAHRMNETSSNAFLKTLEEPHPFVRFLMVTDSIGRILPTIRSRCLAVACEMAPEEVRRTTSEACAVVPQFANRLDEANFAAFSDFASSLGGMNRVGALKFAEDFENLCAGLETEGGTVRQSIADGLEVLATLCARMYPERTDWVHRILQCHRRVLGNVHYGRCLDALFVGLAT